MGKLNKTFRIMRDGKEISLTIKEKVDYYTCLIDAEVNGEVIAKNTKSNISFMESRPAEMFLRFTSIEGQETMLSVCNLDKESETMPTEEIKANREIADYLCIHIQDGDWTAPSYPWTFMHHCNFED